MPTNTDTHHHYWTLSASERAGVLATVMQGLTRLPLDDEDRAALERVLIDAITQSRRKTRRLHRSGYGFTEEVR
jgi:hypothetical protein